MKRKKLLTKQMAKRSIATLLVIAMFFTELPNVILMDVNYVQAEDYSVSSNSKQRIASSGVSGSLDTVDGSVIVGYAYDSQTPDTPISVRLQIADGDGNIFFEDTIDADVYREDLKNKGYGNGNHGFSYDMDWSMINPGTYYVTAFGISESQSIILSNSKTAYKTIKPVLPEDIYYIKNVGTGLYLDVLNAGETQGTVAVQRPLSYADNQQWHLKLEDNGNYTLRPTHASNQALNMGQSKIMGQASGAVISDINLLPTSVSPEVGVQWKLYRDQEGRFQVFSKKNRCLDVLSADSNGNIYGVRLLSSSPSQRWIFEKASNNGVDSAYESHDYELGRAGKLSINDRTGALTYLRSDFGVDGNVFPVSLDFIYDNKSSNLTSGWNTQGEAQGIHLAMKYSVRYQEPYYWLQDENGAVRKLSGNSLKEWKDAAGNIVRNTGTATNYTQTVLTTPNKLEVQFDNLGFAKKITDLEKPNRPYIEINRQNANTTTIYDGVRNRYQLNYLLCSNENKYYLTSIDYYGKGSTILRKIEYSYYPESTKLQIVKYSDGYFVHYEYDNTNNLSAVIEPNGQTWVISYSNGKVNRIQKSAADGTLGEYYTISYASTQTTYTSNKGEKEEVSILTSIYDSLPEPMVSNDFITYDIYGRVIQEISKEGIITENIYDGNNNITSKKVKNGELEIENKFTYTADGNYLLSEIDSVGNIINYTFDTRYGVLTKVDRVGQETIYSFDNLDRQTSIKRPVSNLLNGSSLDIGYEYNGDLLNNIKSNTVTYGITYDKWGLISSIQAGKQILLSNTYVSDSDRNIKQVNYMNGQSRSYSYDNNSILSSISLDGVLRYSYVYKDTELKEKRDNLSGYITSYLDDGKVEIKQGTLLKHSYLKNDESLEEIIGQNITKYEYKKDKDERPISINYNYAANKTAKVIDSYDNLNRRVKETIQSSSGSLSPISVEYSYQPYLTGKTSEFVSQMNFKLPSKSFAYAYTYDRRGNVETAREGALVQRKYSYDGADQLIRVDDNTHLKSYSYQYDNGGNIVKKSEYAYTTGTLGAPLATTDYKYGDSNWKDKLTSYNGKTITYDAIGNPLSYNGTTFVWEGGRQLKSVSKSGNVNLIFTYDDANIRTSKTVNGIKTEYTTIDGNITSETKNGLTTYYRYNKSGAPIAVNFNKNEYFYIKNLHGDITEIVDEKGSSVVQYSYDIWGNLLTIKGSLATTLGKENHLRYCGYFYDEETNLYYLQTRYYSPEWGRFLNADNPEILMDTSETILGANLFQYANNNPANFFDPYGEEAISLFFLGLGILLVTVIAMSIYLNPSFRRAWNTMSANVANRLSAAFRSIGGQLGYAYKSMTAKGKLISRSIGKSFAKVKKIPRYRKNTEKHHVVAKAANSASYAARILRAVLPKGTENPENFIYIKTGLHRRLHTKLYYGWANSVVISAYNSAYGNKTKQKNNVVHALRTIKAFIRVLENAAPF
jgi:RHS repeat-associated protein